MSDMRSDADASDWHERVWSPDDKPPRAGGDNDDDHRHRQRARWPDEIRAENRELPRGIGEWTGTDDRSSYRFNVVLNDRTGRPDHVVYVHGDGILAPDGRAFTARGGSEVYANGGELLAANHVDLIATRAEAA